MKLPSGKDNFYGKLAMYLFTFFTGISTGIIIGGSGKVDVDKVAIDLPEYCQTVLYKELRGEGDAREASYEANN